MGFFHANFDYAATPIGSLGCRVIIHKKVSVRNSWDFRGKYGWILGCSLEHYCCQCVSYKYTKAVQVSETLDYLHHYLTQQTLTPEDRVLYGLQTLTCALEYAPTETCDSQLRDISALRDVFWRWDTTVSGPPRRHRASTKNPKPMEPTTPKQNNTTKIGPPHPPPVQYQRVHTTLTPTDKFPIVDMLPPTVAVNQSGDDKEEPIAHRTGAMRTTPMPSKPLPSSPEPVAKRTRSQTTTPGLAHHIAVDPLQATQRRLPRKFLLEWAMPVMENITGKNIKHPQLQSHSKYQQNWNAYYSNELVRLLQVIVKGSKVPKNQRIKGNETFRVIRYDNIPLN